MPDREKVVAAVECCFHLGSKGCQSCPYVSEVDLEHGCTVDLAGRIIAQLKAPEARVIPLSELLTYDKKWQFNTPPYLCTEEIDAKRMWWRLWGDIYHSIRCEGTMGSNNYGTEWRCWTLHPTEEQRKAVKWDD